MVSFLDNFLLLLLNISLVVSLLFLCFFLWFILYSFIYFILLYLLFTLGLNSLLSLLANALSWQDLFCFQLLFIMRSKRRSASVQSTVIGGMMTKLGQRYLCHISTVRHLRISILFVMITRVACNMVSSIQSIGSFCSPPFTTVKHCCNLSLALLYFCTIIVMMMTTQP